MNRRRLLSLAVLTSVGLPAFGQAPPPMRMVVPFTAGGSPDLIARFLAERLNATFNEAVVVENIVGASGGIGTGQRSEEHTSELQSLMRISYAVFCLKKKKKKHPYHSISA